MNHAPLNFKDITINGQQIFYIADDDGNCIFNKGNILYGYSVKDIFYRYKRLCKKDQDPVYREGIDVKSEIAVAMSFEKEIELRDASERIVKEIEHLYPFVPKEAEWLEVVQRRFEKIHKESKDGICTTTKGNMN